MVVGYSDNRLLTTSAATDNTASSTFGFGNFDLRFVFSHSGADIIKRRTNDVISWGNSLEKSTTKTLQTRIRAVNAARGESYALITTLFQPPVDTVRAPWARLLRKFMLDNFHNMISANLDNIGRVPKSAIGKWDLIDVPIPAK